MLVIFFGNVMEIKNKIKTADFFLEIVIMSKICDSSLITPFILRLMIQETMLQLKNWPVTAVPASNYRSSKSTGHAVTLMSFTADEWEHRSFSLPTCVKIMLGDVCKVS